MNTETLRTLLDFTQDKIVVIDSEGTYQYANAATERILGYDQESFIGTNTFEYIHDDDRARVRNILNRLVGSDAELTETVTYRHRAADGSWVWFESRVWNRADSTLGGYVVSSRDITERKEAQKRQRETENRLKQIAANADDVLWMFSGEWDEVLFVNEAFEEMWGMSRDELHEDPSRFLEEIHPDDRSPVRRAMERLSSGESVELEYRVNSDLSFRRWVWVRGHPIFERGDVTNIVGFARNITNRRRRERQLRVLDNLLRHNLRNTMNIVLGNADLARGYGNDDVDTCMNTIIEAGSDLLDTVEKERRIVDVLCDVGDPVAVDLIELLEDTLTDVRSRYPDAVIRTELPESAPVMAVPEIGYAVRELIENGIEHAGCPPELEVRAETGPGSVSVSVRDNAPPIPDNETEPLFAETDPSAVYHGTGFGLWLVYWIVDLCSGDLNFERTDDDTGNVVTVRLLEAERPR